MHFDLRMCKIKMGEHASSIPTTTSAFCFERFILHRHNCAEIVVV